MTLLSRDITWESHGMHIINSLTYVFHLIFNFGITSVANLVCVCVWGGGGGGTSTYDNIRFYTVYFFKL